MKPEFRLLRGAPAWVFAAAVLVAVIAEGSAIALLAISGWFILISANPPAGFNYLIPSGEVRAAAITRIITRYASNIIAHKATLQWLTRLRIDLYRRVAQAPIGNLRRLGSGQTLDRAMSDADTVDRSLIAAVQPVVVALIGLPIAAGVLAFMSPLAAIILLAGGAATAAVALTVRPHPLASERGSARDQLVAGAAAREELIGLGAVDIVTDDIARQLTVLTRAESNRSAALNRASMLVLVGVLLTTGAVALVVATQGLALPLAGSSVLLTAGTLGLVTELNAASVAWFHGRESAERLRTITSLEPERIPQFEDAWRPEPGSLTLVRGRSGSGKTTLLRRLAGELDQPGGDPPVLDGWVVFVPHDDHLFTGSVAENFRLGAPELTDAEVDDLLEDFGLAKRGFTASTMLGQGGRSASGGEARRLAVARAVAAGPDVILLDEPTEGLDAATATQTLAAVRRRLPEATIVAAVHDRTRLDEALDAEVLSL